MKIIKITICTLILGAITACSGSYYVAPELKESAAVSFSNLSPEIPEIYILIKGKSSQINSNYFEKRKPQQRSRYTLKIPAKEKITFNYVYNWVMGEYRDVVSVQNKLYANVETKTRKEVDTCRNNVSFKSEADKHYEVYFGIVRGKCVIKVSEVFIDKNGRKSLKKLKQKND
ncbi:hypothetical protein MNBD_GAMMA08-276 [hydrothermal vent metagenome]|uniref:Lipoprotein n=1 Tax=hydrothermal vent metagenome TaxID=652676 RepID=A0A3B0X7H7_9ZZZZ